eukprot:Rhum_TRINITY_DN15398_c0_g1::Rhum_TRINITY_DN15398_c0_g1_i2::g.154822::m.154822
MGKKTERREDVQMKGFLSVYRSQPVKALILRLDVILRHSRLGVRRHLRLDEGLLLLVFLVLYLVKLSLLVQLRVEVLVPLVVVLVLVLLPLLQEEEGGDAAAAAQQQQGEQQPAPPAVVVVVAVHGRGRLEALRVQALLLRVPHAARRDVARLLVGQQRAQAVGRLVLLGDALLLLVPHAELAQVARRLQRLRRALRAARLVRLPRAVVRRVRRAPVLRQERRALLHVAARLVRAPRAARVVHARRLLHHRLAAPVALAQVALPQAARVLRAPRLARVARARHHEALALLLAPVALRVGVALALLRHRALHAWRRRRPLRHAPLVLVVHAVRRLVALREALQALALQVARALERVPLAVPVGVARRLRRLVTLRRLARRLLRVPRAHRVLLARVLRRVLLAVQGIARRRRPLRLALVGAPLAAAAPHAQLVLHARRLVHARPARRLAPLALPHAVRVVRARRLVALQHALVHEPRHGRLPRRHALLRLVPLALRRGVARLLLREVSAHRRAVLRLGVLAVRVRLALVRVGVQRALESPARGLRRPVRDAALDRVPPARLRLRARRAVRHRAALVRARVTRPLAERVLRALVLRVEQHTLDRPHGRRRRPLVDALQHLVPLAVRLRVALVVRVVHARLAAAFRRRRLCALRTDHRRRALAHPVALHRHVRVVAHLTLLRAHAGLARRARRLALVHSAQALLHQPCVARLRRHADAHPVVLHDHVRVHARLPGVRAHVLPGRRRLRARRAHHRALVQHARRRRALHTSPARR